MKAVLPLPGDYVNFKSLVPLHKISIGLKQWRYYDFGPKAVPPLICIPGIAGTADVYYKQIMALSTKGYRVISIDIPRVWNHLEWIHAFEKFLDFLNVHHVHIYGTSLGGFLAQIFAQHRPRRVKSLFLSNSFLDTHKFAAAMPWAPVVNWAPSFMLKRHILTGIHDGPQEPFIADSVDFVVGQVETLSRDDLSSRLLLNVNVASVGPISLPDTLITIMDTNDYCAVPQELKDQLNERYPGARKAVLKTGGDFPFLSRSDEVNLYLQAGRYCVDLVSVPSSQSVYLLVQLVNGKLYEQIVRSGTNTLWVSSLYIQLHLRRVGVEARPDLLQGIPRYDGGAGSSNSGGNNNGSHFDNNKDDPRGGQNGGDDLQDFGSESLDSDEPVPTSTMYDSLALCTVVKFAILEELHAHLLLQQFCVAFCLYMSRSKASLVA